MSKIFHSNSTCSYAASYKKIHIQGKNKPDEEKLVLTCHSEGFPPAEVFWHNEKNQSVSANTTYTLTTDGLYNVTSIATVKPETGENYSCMFWNKELNEATLASVSTLGLYLSLNLFEFVHGGFPKRVNVSV